MAAHMGASTVLAPRRASRIAVATPLALSGAAIAVAGTALPWVTIFRGTQVLTGWDGSARYIAGLAVASAMLTLLFLGTGRAVPLRRIALLAGFGAIVGAAVERGQLVSSVSSTSITNRILEPVLGAGSMVLLAGTVLLLAVAAVPAARGARLPAGFWPRLVLAGALFTAGWIHLVLTPEHLGEAPILGVGFLLAAVAQLALAGLVMMRPSDLVYNAVVALSVALVVLYAIAVFKGLPFGGAHDHATGLVVGSGEPIDLEGAVSKAAELFSVVTAFVLVGRRASPALRSAV